MDKIIYALSYREFIDSMEMSKITDENIESKPKYCLIEIMGEQDLLIHPFYFKQDHRNVLRLLFDDVDQDVNKELFDSKYLVTVIPMSEEQCEQIVSFINDNVDLDVYVVHCAAGVSRSAGIARYIDWKMNTNDALFHRNNPIIKPNQRIFSMLKAEEERRYFH